MGASKSHCIEVVAEPEEGDGIAQHGTAQHTMAQLFRATVKSQNWLLAPFESVLRHDSLSDGQYGSRDSRIGSLFGRPRPGNGLQWPWVTRLGTNHVKQREEQGRPTNLEKLP